MSSLAIFFLLCLSLHACNARLLSFVAEEIGNQVNFFAKDINKLNLHELEMRPSKSIAKELKAQEIEEVGDRGRRIHESWIGANAMKQTLLSSFLKAKEAVAKDFSGHEVNFVISSGFEHLENMEKLQGCFKRVERSMLGDSSEEAVDSKEKDNMGDIDVMDYAQPHRKPPIHNEKS